MNSHSYKKRSRRAISLTAVILTAAFLFTPSGKLWAICTPLTVTVTTTAGDTSAGSLGDAINQINASPCGGTINLSGIATGTTITLTGNLPYITQSVTILGNNVNVSGNSSYGILNLGGGVSVAAGLNDSISNINLINGKAQGSNGGSYNEGGGGGLGAGGGIFVNSGVTLTVNTVSFNGDSAVGGTGGNVTSVGNFSPGTYSGGGGGINGSGAGVNGYYSSGVEYSGAGGGVNGGTGSTADNQNGGNGGWGGGGGAAGWGATGGNGGFGGGGGGSDLFQGGNGGFGGGGGADGLGYTGGFGGAYGGRGGCSGCYQNADQAGGGGAGLGGGIFLYQGAALNIAGSTFTSNTVQGGAPGLGAGSISTGGQGLGQDIFTYGSAVVFNGSSITTVPDTIAGTGSVVVSGTGSVTLSAVNTYSGGTTLSGGLLAIGNDNNMGTGNLTFDGGTLFTTAGITSSKGISVTGNGGTFNGNGFNSTLSGAITGTGLLGVRGSGALTLSGNNSSFSGGLSVTGGTLDIGNANNLGTGTLTLDGSKLQTTAGVNASNNLSLTSNNGTIDTNGFNSTLSGTISGSGALTKINAGTLTLTGTNSYGGGTTLTAGRLNINNDNNLGTGLLALNGGVTLQTAAGINSATRSIVLTGSDTFDSNGFNSTLGGTISGSGALTKISAGTLTLTGTNSYGGGTTVSGGTLNINNDNNLGSGLLALNNGTTLQTAAGINSASRSIVLTGIDTFDSNGFNSTLGGVVSGSGSLTKISAGSLTLTGTNTYTGGTTLTGGTLSVGNDNNLGTGNLTFNGGTLQTSAGITSSKNVVLTGNNGTFDSNGSNSTLSGNITGTGGLNKNGLGTLTLSGSNSYSGFTDINAGTLALGSSTALSSNFTAVTIASGAVLGLGGYNATIGSLNGSGGVSLGSGSLTDGGNNTGASFGGVISGTGTFVKVGSAALTLTGTNTYSGGTTLSNGTLSVGNDNNLGTGTLTLNGGTLQTSAGITSSKNVVLTGNNGTFDTNGFNSTLSGVISGSGGLNKNGSGILTLSGSDTYTGFTNINAGTLFMGAANVLSNSTTVSLASGTVLDLGSNNQSIGSLTGSGGVSLGSASLTAGTNNQTTAYSGVIGGTGSLTKTGTGTFTLSGTNTFSGGTTFTAGIVSVGNDNNLGTGNLTFNGGTLQTSAGITSSKNAAFTSNNGTFNTNGFNSTLNGVLSGAGALTKTGNGTLTLTGTNTYGGGTTVNGGTLNVDNDNNLGTGLLALNGTTLQTAAGINSASRSIVLAGSDNLDTQSFNSTFGGIVSGTGSLTKTGSGSLTLTGGNTYSGGTSINGGLLSVGADNNLGTGNLEFNSSTLQLSSSFNTAKNVSLGAGGVTVDTNGNILYVGGTVSGTGRLTKTGSGALTLTGTNSYSGGTNLNAGTLDVGNDNNLGTGNLTFNGGTLQTTAGISSSKNISLTGNGTFDSNGSDSSLSGVISGTGQFTKTGAGSLTVTGANTYTGLTDVNNGSLVLSVSGALRATAAVTVESSGTLDLGGKDQTLGNLSGSGLVLFGAGNLKVGDSTNQLFSGVMSGAGSLTKTGSGALTLTAANSYSGGTSVSGGTLNVDNDNNLGTGNLVLDGGSLQTAAGITSAKNIQLTSNNGAFDSQAFNSTLSGDISGVGGLTKLGSGALTMTGVNTFTGGMLVSAGTVALGDAGSLTARINGPVSIASGATLTGYGSILGVVNNNGTVQPGGNNGTLSIGQLFDTATSSTNIELAPGNLQSGRLNVLFGQLNGALTIAADPGNYGVRYKYIILTTGAPVTGSFASVSDNLSYMTPTLLYGNNAVTLVLTRNNADFTTSAATSNQKAVATVLNSAIPTASDDFVALLNVLYGLPAAQQQSSLAQMNGSSYAPLAAVMVNNNASSVNLLMQRAGGPGFVPPSSFQSMLVGRAAFDLTDTAPSLSAGLKEAQNSPENSGLWVESSSGSLSQDGNGNVVGYKSQNTGFLGGYDVALAKNLRGGLWGSYNRMDMNSTDAADTSSVDNYLVGLYGGPSFGNVALTGVVAYGVDHYKTTRAVDLGSQSSQALGVYDGSELMGALRASYALKVSGVSVNPLAGLQYTRLYENGFTETGAGDLNLTVASQQYQSLRPLVGFDASKGFDLGGGTQLVPMVSANVSEELMALNPAVSASLAGAPGSNFLATGINPSPTLVGLSAGAKLSFGQGLNLFAQYLGGFGGGQSSNAFNGGVDFSL